MPIVSLENSLIEYLQHILATMLQGSFVRGTILALNQGGLCWWPGFCLKTMCKAMMFYGSKSSHIFGHHLEGFSLLLYVMHILVNCLSIWFSGKWGLGIVKGPWRSNYQYVPGVLHDKWLQDIFQIFSCFYTTRTF